jgi:hypothetical protein
LCLCVGSGSPKRTDYATFAIDDSVELAVNEGDAAHKKKLLYKLNWSNSTRRKNFFCSISSKICSFFFLGVLTKLGMTILTG